MSDSELIEERRGATLWLTFNRPQARNAMTFAMYDRLGEICSGIARDGDIRAIVMTGAGDRAFAAGTDMTQFRGFASEEDALDYEHRMDVVLGAVEKCPVPTIAAIARACTGGGAGIAAACDIRIATADLKFGFPIARTLGNCLSIPNLSRLSALIGPGRVKEVIFTARLVEAEEAKAIGLVSEIVPDHAGLMARAQAIADLLADHAPITLSTTKEALRRLRTEGAGADDRDLVVEAYMSEDFREGMEAFLGKRKPRWKGR
ncbi:MAG: enoyl-CoA hydratase/isomerase family protein [Pararhizobium sp.]